MMLVVLRVVVCVHMFMLFHFACLSSHSCHPEENSALLHFKTSLIIDTTFYDDDYYAQTCPHVYPKTSTWKNGTDCCSWMGVTCHSVSGHVIGLDLACSRLEAGAVLSTFHSSLSSKIWSIFLFQENFHNWNFLNCPVINLKERCPNGYMIYTHYII
ncbi:hypothetical protein AAHE18_07G020300 [Arachis hypogaea]